MCVCTHTRTHTEQEGINKLTQPMCICLLKFFFQDKVSCIPGCLKFALQSKMERVTLNICSSCLYLPVARITSMCHPTSFRFTSHPHFLSHLLLYVLPLLSVFPPLTHTRCYNVAQDELELVTQSRMNFNSQISSSFCLSSAGN